MNYKIILFDLDNTLIDFAASQKAGLQCVHRKFYPEVKFDHLEACFKKINYALWKCIHEVPANQIRHLRFEQLNQTLDYHPELEAVIASYELSLSQQSQWFSGVKETIQRLHQASYIMGVITNGFRQTQNPKYQNLKMDQWFDCFIISDEVKLAKPDKAIFHLAHEQLVMKHGKSLKEIDPKSILMVGDSLQSDGQGAHNAGFSFCWIAPHSAKRIEGVPIDHHYKSVAELSKLLPPYVNPSSH